VELKAGLASLQSAMVQVRALDHERAGLLSRMVAGRNLMQRGYEEPSTDMRWILEAEVRERKQACAAHTGL
jgi:hypothetical protein